MNRTTTSDDTEESLTKVDVDNLTDYEMREVIPACDFVVVGYDSSYSDADESTKRVNDPANTKEAFRCGGVCGPIAGDDADDADRKIGFGRGDIRTSSSSGRIGTVLWIAYPAPKPDKTRYTVTFRALAGNSSTARPVDDVDVDSLVESTVDKYAFDDVEAPPEDDRAVEDVQVDEGRTQRRVTVDVPVTLTIADADTTDVDEVVERARQVVDGGNMTPHYSAMTPRGDLPDVGDHIVERDQVGMNDLNVRRNTRYWELDVQVETETVD